MLRAVRSIGDTIMHSTTLCSIGHNPGMHSLALDLCGAGSEADLEALHFKYPTAALAVIDFDQPWAALKMGEGRLRRFVVPRELKKA